MIPVSLDIKCFKGFTIIELLVSTIILVTVSCLFFAAMLSMSKLTTTSRSELEAYASANMWLERVRTGAAANTRYNAINTCSWTNIAGGILPSNPSTWKLNSKVDNLAGTYAVSNADLGSGALFKKISVKLTWDERR
jgi:type II secretory pathway pseudopilin PulG